MAITVILSRPKIARNLATNRSQSARNEMGKRMLMATRLRSEMLFFLFLTERQRTVTGEINLNRSNVFAINASHCDDVNYFAVGTDRPVYIRKVNFFACHAHISPLQDLTLCAVNRLGYSDVTVYCS